MEVLSAPERRWLASLDITIDADGTIVPVITDCRHTLMKGGFTVLGTTIASHLEDAALHLRTEVEKLKSADARGLARKE